MISKLLVIQLYKLSWNYATWEKDPEIPTIGLQPEIDK
jgi:hypothetical protein